MTDQFRFVMGTPPILKLTPDGGFEYHGKMVGTNVEVYEAVMDIVKTVPNNGDAMVYIAAWALSELVKKGTPPGPGMQTLSDGIAEAAGRIAKLREALGFYIAIVGNTGYSITRESAQQAYDMANKAMEQ